MIGVATAQASQSLGPIGAVPWPASASVAHLKVNGTAMVASFAAKISTVANSTRALRSALSAGQIYGQRWTSIDNSPARSAFTTRLWLTGAVANSLIAMRLTGRLRHSRQLHPAPSYRDSRRSPHPRGPCSVTLKWLARRANRRHMYSFEGAIYEQNQCDLRVLRIESRHRPGVCGSG